MCLCSQPSLTERTVDDHRQLPARYGAMGSALRARLLPSCCYTTWGDTTPTRSTNLYNTFNIPLSEWAIT